MKTIGKLFGHLKTVCIHKWYVFYYCCMAGIPWQGIIHDLSKFSIQELRESVRYYTGTVSPIDTCKKENGVSYAWMHHKGRNPHHYEYWQDNFDNGGHPIKMPYKYAVESLCDYLGAGRAYNGKSFAYHDEFVWWMKKREHAAMHPAMIAFFDMCFYDLMVNGSKALKRKYTLKNYKKAMESIVE